MHAAVCLLHAGQPRSAGDAKSGQFVGQFSWVTGDPIVLKGLNTKIISNRELFEENKPNYNTEFNVETLISTISSSESLMISSRWITESHTILKFLVIARLRILRKFSG